MRALLDVNVLLPLLDRLHVDHPAAIRWFAANRSAGWASCPFTETACLHLLTNPRYSSPQTPEQVDRFAQVAEQRPSYVPAR